MRFEKPSLKEIIYSREDSLRVKKYNKEHHVHILRPVNYDELLDYLIRTKQTCFYDEKGPVMVVKPPLFSLKNY